MNKKNPAAVALGKLGAKTNLAKGSEYFIDLAKKSVKARNKAKKEAKKLSPLQRTLVEL